MKSDGVSCKLVYLDISVQNFLRTLERLQNKINNGYVPRVINRNIKRKIRGRHNNKNVQNHFKLCQTLVPYRGCSLRGSQ